MTKYTDKQVDLFRDLWAKEGHHLSRGETIERMESAEVEADYTRENCPHTTIITKKAWTVHHRQVQRYRINYEKAVLENTIESQEPYELSGSSTELKTIKCAWCDRLLFDSESHGPTDLAALLMSLESWDRMVEKILQESTEYDRWVKRGEIP